MKFSKKFLSVVMSFVLLMGIFVVGNTSTVNAVVPSLSFSRVDTFATIPTGMVFIAAYAEDNDCKIKISFNAEKDLYTELLVDGNVVKKASGKKFSVVVDMTKYKSKEIAIGVRNKDTSYDKRVRYKVKMDYQPVISTKTLRKDITFDASGGKLLKVKTSRTDGYFEVKVKNGRTYKIDNDSYIFVDLGNNDFNSKCIKVRFVSTGGKNRYSNTLTIKASDLGSRIKLR